MAFSPLARPVRWNDLGVRILSALVLIPCAAAEDVNPQQSFSQQLLEALDRGDVARCKTLEDGARKQRLIAGTIFDRRITTRAQLFVQTSRHGFIQQQRRSIHIDCPWKISATLRLGDKRLDRPCPAGLAPTLDALLHNPHAVHVGVKLESAAGRALIGESGLHGFRRCNRRRNARAHQRPCPRADVGDFFKRGWNARNGRRRIVTRRNNQIRVSKCIELREFACDFAHHGSRRHDRRQCSSRKTEPINQLSGFPFIVRRIIRRFSKNPKH